MIDSEIEGLRKRKTKRILIWVAGIAAAAVLVVAITILSFMGDGSS